MESVLNVAMTIGDMLDRASTILGLPQSAIGMTIDGVAQSVGGGAGGGRGGGRGNAPASMASPPPPAPNRARADVMNESTVSELMAGQQSDATAQALGDLFEYHLKDPVTIHRNQSALVPILVGDVEAERVSLWNASSGSARPLRAVWLTNSTGLTLDGGSFSVIDGDAFAGEGLVQPMKPAERRLLSYAADLGVQVVPRNENQPSSITRVAINRGLLIQYTEQRQQTTYVVRNEDTDPRVIVLEHPVRAGWSIGGSSKPDETTAQWNRFRVPVAAKTTVNFVVDESRTGQTQYAISSMTDDQITVLVRGQFITPAIEAQLREAMRQKSEIARLAGEMGKRQAEIDTIGRDQQRVRENMQALKGSAEEKQLLQRYVKQLDEQETRLGTLRQDLQSLTTEHTQAQAALNAFIAGLSTGTGPGIVV